MFLDVITSKLTRILLLLALLSTTYLYLYPVWLGCTFPSTDGSRVTAFRDALKYHLNQSSSPTAPFRLLVLADPQLEGDSSLPKPEDFLLHKVSSHWQNVQNASVLALPFTVAGAFTEILVKDIPREINAWRKRLDLLGNDYYLAHIFRTLHWWTNPTHVTVLGDLIGSQWVDDAEFEYRGWRFWNRVFVKGRKVEDEIMALYNEENPPLLAMDDWQWKTRIINIAGNHDIGYAGDISEGRIDRFEKTFGKANWDVRFKYPGTTGQEGAPSLHLVVMNSMLLDTPALNESLQSQTYAYLNSVIAKRARPVEDRSSFVLFLTHVPQHKEAGICIDAPFFDFFPEAENCTGLCRPGGLKEQNHLSPPASQGGTLEAMFGMSGKTEVAAQGKGRPGLILDGHDHEGCDVWHYIPHDNMTYKVEDSEVVKTNWQAIQWRKASTVTSHTGIREVTLRSMMGEFGGNAGLLSAWFDFDTGEWQHEIKTCRVGIQHVWWAVHVIDILAIISVPVTVIRSLLHLGGRTRPGSKPAKRKRTKLE